MKYKDVAITVVVSVPQTTNVENVAQTVHNYCQKHGYNHIVFAQGANGGNGHFMMSKDITEFQGNAMLQILKRLEQRK